MSKNRSKIVPKMVKILENRALGLSWSTLGSLLAPRWPKMRVGSHLGLHLETSWDSSCRQDGPSWGEMAPRWRYVGQLGPQDGQLGSSLGGILAHFSDLERDLSKNSGSVKNERHYGVLVTNWRVGRSGWRLLGAILDEVGSKMELFGLSWAMLGRLRGEMT